MGCTPNNTFIPPMNEKVPRVLKTQWAMKMV